MAAICVGLAAGSATASKPHPARQTANPTAAASARSIAQTIERAVKDAQEIKSHASAAKNGKGIVVRHFPLGSALDGQYAFISRLAVKVTRNDRRRHNGGIVNFRLQIDRVIRASGERTRVFDKLDRYPISMYARGGQLALQTFKWSDLENGGDGSSGVTKALLTTYSGPEDAATIGATASEIVTIDDEDQCLTLGLLIGLTETGSQVLAQLEGKCGGSGLPQQSAAIATRNPDGSLHTITPAAFASIGRSALSASGDGSILFADPNGAALMAIDRDGGEARALWSPSARLTAVGADGTVALVGSTVAIPGREQYDLRTGREKTNASKNPFVIFPGGDAENPMLAAASRKSIAALQFCGNNLYVFNGDRRYVRERGYSDGDDDFLDSFFGGGIADTSLDIQLYNSQGQFQRSLKKTKRAVLTSTGCNADALVFATVKSAYATPHITEVTP